MPHSAHGQARIIHAKRFRSDKDCVHASAKLVRVTACSGTCDPARLAGSACQSAIETHAAFCDYKRSPGDNPFVEALVKMRALLSQNPIAYMDTGISQLRNASPRMTRIHIRRSGDDIFYAGLHNCIRAWACAPERGAGFQRDVEYRASGYFGAECAQALDLSMFVARPSMMAFCNDPIGNHQNCADSWIRTGLPDPFLRFL